ncbi:MAG: SPW repeat protein [Streptosporangiaceae bacterium]
MLAATAAMLTGLWVAISPWFLTLQASRGANAAVNNLIIGLSVAGLCLLMMGGVRNVEGLETAGLLAGVWLIISPFILDAKVPTTASMYWSNIWSGAIVIVIMAALTALAVLARAGRVRPADSSRPGGPVFPAGPPGRSCPSPSPAGRPQRATLALPRPAGHAER